MDIGSGRKLRILVADDSAVMRGIMRTLFITHTENVWSELPAMELCGVARDGVECLGAVKELLPDVLVLDLEMPRMHGLDVLDKLRQERPDLPVIMCSTYTERGARLTLDALARGASDYVMKPSETSDFVTALRTLSDQLLRKIAALGDRSCGKQAVGDATQRRYVDEVTLRGRRPARIEAIVIGVSTGGPAALEVMLPRLPADLPVPVLIVQHMPKLFTGELAERLDRCCALRVKEAYEGAILAPGTAWIAPGDMHMEVGRSSGAGGGSRVCLHQAAPLNFCRPSVDYLFHSAVKVYGAGTLAVVMTGMGADGLAGARAVHEAGGTVLAQDEASSVVWGMPGRVAQSGIASATLPLWELADELTERSREGRAGCSERNIDRNDGQRSQMPADGLQRQGMTHGLL